MAHEKRHVTGMMGGVGGGGEVTTEIQQSSSKIPGSSVKTSKKY